MNKLSWPKAALSAIAITLSTSPALACGPDTQLGDICYTAAYFCPGGFLPAEGQRLDISQYQALFFIMGNTYGGDGRYSFALPDLRGRVPAGVGQGPPGLRSIGLGWWVGRESIYLVESQLPAHAHAYGANGTIPASQSYVSVHSGAGTQLTPNGDVLLATSTAGDAIYTTSPSTGAAVPVDIPARTAEHVFSTGVTGKNDTFEISQPSVVLTACIALKGIYPERN